MVILRRRISQVFKHLVAMFVQGAAVDTGGAAMPVEATQDPAPRSGIRAVKDWRPPLPARQNFLSKILVWNATPLRLVETVGAV